MKIPEEKAQMGKPAPDWDYYYAMSLLKSIKGKYGLKVTRIREALFTLLFQSIDQIAFLNNCQF